jgi:hypothetical protein
MHPLSCPRLGPCRAVEAWATRRPRPLGADGLPSARLDVSVTNLGLAPSAPSEGMLQVLRRRLEEEGRAGWVTVRTLGSNA